MQKQFFFFLVLLSVGFSVYGQEPSIQVRADSTASREQKKESPFKTGFYPIGFFDIDLKYIIKLNNYEGLRLGVGGITNEKLSESFRLGGYMAYGFKDRGFKYSIGGAYRVNEETNTWINGYYIDDIREIGSFNYLTDDRVYSVFEPRLVNVTQFYKHKTQQVNIQHEFSNKFLSEFRVSRSEIRQIENYQFIQDGEAIENYEVFETTASVRISPKTNFFTTEDGLVEYFDGFPKFSGQITKGYSGVLGSDFDYYKFGLKIDYYIKRTDLSSTNFLVEGLLATGDIPLTHLFHAYPNAPTKETILQRFSVAGTRSFETMYFGEFFSDKLVMFQAKHSLRRFYFSDRFKPELVFLTKHAIGSLDNPEQHQGIGFQTLDHIYNESGIELNKLIFGFGLSFAYRYGHFELPEFEDNVSFKFTFNLKV